MQGELALTPRTNTGLFSEYYLDEVLIKHLDEYKGAQYLEHQYLQEKWELLRSKMEQIETYIDKRNEAQTKKDVIEPILTEILGHFFDVEFRDGSDNPDYTLFASKSDLEQAKKHTDEPEEYRKYTIGLADAKSWKKTGYSNLQSNAPIAQIHRYLTNHKRRWGFITNGNQWRLFAHKEGVRQDEFIEFNLLQILTKDWKDPNFKLFLYLFRREAFVRDAEGKAVLDHVLYQSVEEAEGLREDLKDKVYQALALVAEEFRRMNKLSLDTEDERRALKDNSLVFLYRILFLLYAESKLILPVPESQGSNGKQTRYYRYSLARLRARAIEERDALANKAEYWGSLLDLFHLIHGLDEEDNEREENKEIPLPPYNGGLFSPKEWPKLETWRLGDRTVREVLTLLTRTTKQYGKRSEIVNVSYRDLGVQHLGNIYEGILENKLVLKDGKVDVENDKGERKATGSYYTPDYIVDYIVKETIGPLVKDAKSPEEILKINVLDPAMGSGHFLVGAIDYLSERIADVAYLYEKTPEGEPHAFNEEELKNCRREVAERCVYGVDLNPMAVELAKLSIWLHTISSQKPLTFLDNHIKCGNSLIGARIDELGTLPQKKKASDAKESAQEGLFPLRKLKADASFWIEHGRLYKVASDNIDQVKAKEVLERDIDKRREKYKHLADLWTAYFFLQASPTDFSVLFRQLSEAIVVNAPEAPLPKSDLLTEALRIAEEKRFFHWELEFPEIYFDKRGERKENAGFDAVIGNPPYVRQETLGETKELYYKPSYLSYSNMADIYVYFYELGERNLRQSGTVGMITSNKFMRANYGKPLRIFLAEHIALEQIIDFGELPVFAEAATMPVILIGRKTHVDQQNFIYTQVKSLNFTNLEDVVKSTGQPLNGSGVDGENWSLISQETADFRKRISLRCKPLKEYIPKKVHFGIKTGFNKAFVIDQGKKNELIENDPRNAEIIRSFIVGDDVRKYHVNFEKRFLIWTYIGVPIQSYPGILEHLSKFRRPEGDLSDETFIEERQDQGEQWWELRACDYYDEFEGAKIVYPDIAKESRFTLDREGYFFSNTAYMIPADDVYLLAILNSKLIWHIYKQYAAVLGDADKGGRLRWFTQYVEQLPIRVITNKEDHDKHKELSDLAEQMLAMNKGKQELAKKFFESMDDYGLPSPDKMKPKTFLDDFWKKDYKAVLAHLKKNKARLTIEDEDKLKERFIKSSEALNILDTKITHTDWLIDQVVYALYGLTDEEIRVVEGKQN